jgi:hypothetical protein
VRVSLPSAPPHIHTLHSPSCVQDRSRRCCNVLRAVQALVPHSCPIQMVKQGGQLEIKFHMCLIEDRSAALLHALPPPPPPPLLF